jgi:hypothetical protein
VKFVTQKSFSGKPLYADEKILIRVKTSSKTHQTIKQKEFCSQNTTQRVKSNLFAFFSEYWLIFQTAKTINTFLIKHISL